MHATTVDFEPDIRIPRQGPALGAVGQISFIVACPTWQVYGNVHSHKYASVYYCSDILRPLWATTGPGELEGTSLAVTQARIPPVPSLLPMFRVSAVLRRGSGWFIATVHRMNHSSRRPADIVNVP